MILQWGDMYLKEENIWYWGEDSENVYTSQYLDNSSPTIDGSPIQELWQTDICHMQLFFKIFNYFE